MMKTNKNNENTTPGNAETKPKKLRLNSETLRDLRPTASGPHGGARDQGTGSNQISCSCVHRDGVC